MKQRAIIKKQNIDTTLNEFFTKLSYYSSILKFNLGFKCKCIMCCFILFLLYLKMKKPINKKIN